MKQWYSIFICLCYLLFAPLTASGQEKRQFDQGAIASYKSDPDFNYTEDYAAQSSFMAVLVAYFLSLIHSLFGVFENQWIAPVFVRVLLIGAIILAIFMILRLKFGKAFYKTSRKFDDLPLNMLQDERQDYNALFKDSLNNRQYKLAVRYLFLETLVTLEEQRIITIAKWKAPYDYVQELPEEKKSPFRRLAEMFESIWYGDEDPDQGSVDQGLEWRQSIIGEKRA